MLISTINAMPFLYTAQPAVAVPINNQLYCTGHGNNTVQYLLNGQLLAININNFDPDYTMK